MSLYSRYLIVLLAKLMHWGKKYQEEEKKNKLEFLNRLQLQYNWDNDELKELEGLVEELAHPDIPAQFPGIELERELDDDATSAMTILEASGS